MWATELYTDGGVAGRNPSWIGGSWAWVSLDSSGEPIRAEDGAIVPADVGMQTISNNLTELEAAIRGLESLPDAWAGIFYTDSLITLRRVTQPAGQSFANIPDAMRQRCLTIKTRLGAFRAVLLGGHPTKDDLVKGVRAHDGKPVSIWNKFCDERCQVRAKELLAAARKQG